MKPALIAMWRLFRALAFYPLMLVTGIWLWLKGAHWIWGVGIIAAILIFDPIWRIMGRNLLRILSGKTPH